MLDRQFMSTKEHLENEVRRGVAHSLPPKPSHGQHCVDFLLVSPEYGLYFCFPRCSHAAVFLFTGQSVIGTLYVVLEPDKVFQILTSVLLYLLICP